MQIISQPNNAVIKILKSIVTLKKSERSLHYCVELQTEEGHLLFNLLTREMVLLSEEEWENRLDNNYLNSHCFFVPQNCKEKEYADLLRWIIGNKTKKQPITEYTVFTTTDCNARCFYCFELAGSRIPMTEETAHRTASYIADHCGGNKVKIHWFGGEPLFNKTAIEIICKDLREKGIVFSSKVISNGYLFDADTVKNAVDNWNLRRVQITLDGTERIYNKVKAYIYKQGSPYQRVMENIGHLLDARVSVVIRLNMDMHNAEDLLKLVEELAERFAGKQGLTVYARHLFDGSNPMADSHSYKEWEIRDAAMICLEEKIESLGLGPKGGIRKTVMINYCMADSGKAVTILPEGQIGLCDHFSESEFIGHIDREGFDQTVVNSWRERVEETSECVECFYYPDCLQLKKCSNKSICFEQMRREYRRQTERQMRNEYRRWQDKTQEQEENETEFC